MLRTLQAGRGVAALAVAAFHLSLTFSAPLRGEQLIFWGATFRMNLGVDFFFVLSGFIILFAHQNDIGLPQRLRNYGFKRFVRVYPVYWVVTAGLVLASIAGSGRTSLPQSLGDLASTVMLVRWTPHGVPVGAAWTLFHEVLFYALFAVLILNRKLGLLVLALWATLILALFDYQPHGPLSIWTTIVSARNLSFFCGMAAFFIAARLRGGGAALTAVGGLGLVIGDLVFESWVPASNLSHLGYSIGFMLLIAGLVALERDSDGLTVPLLGLIGDASYSLYLIHENTERVLIKVAARLRAQDWIDAHLLYGVVLVATVLIALVFHRLVEQPLVRAGQRWRRSRTVPA